jgi:hypothetical protein
MTRFVTALGVLIGLVALEASAWAMCEVLTTPTFAVGTVLAGPPCGTTGGQKTELSTTIAGENIGLDRLTVTGDYTTVAISTATTTTIKTGPGVIGSCQVLGGTLGAITVYDNTAASGTVIAPAFTPTATVPGTQILPDIRFSVGLTIVTAAATILQCSFL